MSTFPAWAVFVVDLCGAWPVASVDVGAAAPDFASVVCVEGLRCGVEGCRPWPLGRLGRRLSVVRGLGAGVVCCVVVSGFRPVFLINWPIHFFYIIEKASLLPGFKKKKKLTFVFWIFLFPSVS